jgi:uncharacterized protein (DUF983 family)
MALPESYSDRTFCPHCGEQLNLNRLDIYAVSKCPVCESLLAVSTLYRVVTWFLIIGASLLLASAFRVKAYAAVAWIPLLLTSAVLVTIFAKALFPPKVKLVPMDAAGKRTEPWLRNLSLLLMFWFGQTFFLVAYSFIAGSAYLLGGTQEDIRELCAFFSLPLALVNSRFEISPTISLPALFGIVFANSFFYAVTYTALTRIVQARLRKPFTKLGISATQPDDDDDCI